MGNAAVPVDAEPRAWFRRPWQRTLAYPALLALAVADSAGYSVIGPVLPALGERTGSGPALLGTLAATFPLAMLAGMALSGMLVRRGLLRPTLACSLVIAVAGSVWFAASDGLLGWFAARALMGFGSGGLWITITFATLAYWPGREYVCMSRIYAAYSAGALLGPLLGALGGIAAPFLTYSAVLVVTAAGTLAVPEPHAGTFGSDRDVLRSARFWAAAVAIMLAILGAGALDGVLPLHFGTRLSQAQIGLAYVGVAALIAVGSAAAGHQPPRRMLAAGALAITAGLTLAGGTTSLTAWAVALALIGLGAGTAQVGATGLLLRAVPTAGIVAAMVVWSQLGVVGYLAAPAVGGLIAEHVGFGALGVLPAMTGLVVVSLLRVARRPGG
jgi:MFS family permease